MSVTFKKSTYPLLFVFLSFFSLRSFSQDGGQVHGNVQIDAQYYRNDSTIGAVQPEEEMLMNAFANVIYTNGNFTAGVRYEAYLNPLLGYPQRYEGNGFPYRFVQYKKDIVDITAGSFYEQFGSGMILRTYEERLLGVDNALDGFRVKLNLYKGVYVKGVYGKQRVFFEKGPGIVRGIDGEVNVNQLLDSTFLGRSKTKFILGGSFVSKYQDPSSTLYKLPANVGAWGSRLNIIRGGFNWYTEYVYKINDPSNDNKFIYKPGQAFLSQLNYGRKGLGIMLAMKYIDNMSFRSDRNEELANLMINYLPALTRPHTYNLPATLYPYATQPNGEFGLQGEVSYKFKPKSTLGGKYGTQITVNYAFVNSIDTTELHDDYGKRLHHSTRFLAMGDSVFFRDLNIEIKKKFSKNFTAVLTYINMVYNIELSQGHLGDLIYADMGIMDLTYKINRKNSIRFEAQHLSTKQDRGNWVTGLIEYTVSPHWFFAALNQYNYGNENLEDRDVYPYFTFGYIKDALRITIGAGKQRQGLFCVGGVCRPVPASNGLSLSITSSF